MSACLALIGVSFSYGVAVGRYEIFPYAQARTLRDLMFGDEAPPGRWHRTRPASDPAPLGRETSERLSALGYLGGYTSAEGAGGVTAFDPGAVQDGLTLFSSGHAPVASLVSLTGEVVHQWEVSFEELWPNELPFETAEEHKQFLRRVHVFPNGDLLAVFEYIGLVKLDGDSNVLWKSLTRNHHDIAVDTDGSIVTLVHHPLSAEEMASKYPGFEPQESGILDDQIVLLSSDGVERERVSLFDAFYHSEYASVLAGLGRIGDVFHANSVHIVKNPAEGSPFREGEILISLRKMSAILTVDMEAGRVSWMLSGKWKNQHQAVLVEGGNILVLDNLGGNRRDPLKLDRSQVLEFDPASQQIVWRYAGSDDSPFFTHWLGYVQRLRNGNTLVTESSRGRIFEITREGSIVWEYRNPHRAGDEGELIATVMGARRISPEQLAFLDR